MDDQRENADGEDMGLAIENVGLSIEDLGLSIEEIGRSTVDAGPQPVDGTAQESATDLAPPVTPAGAVPEDMAIQDAPAGAALP
ncbi:MAG: hypothetical protein LJE63_09145, partial [Desulfobacteraceae bacterium]|nr:hypothetical protein [Desulfobacteraceae bacterium]